MLFLAGPLVAAAAGLLPETRSFWRPDPDTASQPAQTQVATHLVHVTERMAVYLEDGYTFARRDTSPEAARIAALVETFERSVAPRLEAIGGAPPDRDDNGKVLLVVGRLARPALFWRFDLMSALEAAGYGFRSNEAEVIFLSMEYEGNRSGLNLEALTSAYFELLVGSGTRSGLFGWSKLAAAFSPHHLGLAPARGLWGAYPSEHAAVHLNDPAGFGGYSLLFAEYLVERMGEDALRITADGRPLALELQPKTPGGSNRPEEALLADFGMACWLDSPEPGGGRFQLTRVDPPLPPAQVEAVASRPTSGVVQVGIGSTALVVIRGRGERSFPLTLKGDPSARWVARAVLQRRTGPDEELSVTLATSGQGHLDLPPLGDDEQVVVAVTAAMGDAPGADHREVSLLWGIGWVPHLPVDTTRGILASLVEKAIPDAGDAVKERLAATLQRLSGKATEPLPAPGLGLTSTIPQEPLVVTTRYAWAPQADRVPRVIVQEAGRRGLTSRLSGFTQKTLSGVAQTWSNVLVDGGGADRRRWPVVIAAHWDAARSTQDESYRDALRLDDNATGVAVALEAASALSRSPHRAPVLVVLLAGGHQGAAGARALLDELRNKVAAWIELDCVGIPDQAPRGLFVHIEGERALSEVPQVLGRALKRAGLVARPRPDYTPGHCGAQVAAERGIPAVVVRTTAQERSDATTDIPPVTERDRVSPDLMALLVRAVAEAAQEIAGIPTP